MNSSLAKAGAPGALQKLWKALAKQKAVLAILVMLLGMLFFDTNFYTAYNWLEMLRSMAILEIVAWAASSPLD